VNGLVEKQVGAFCGAFLEDFGCIYESEVIVEDGDEPCGAYEFEVALPEAVRIPALPGPAGSFQSNLLERPFLARASLLPSGIREWSKCPFLVIAGADIREDCLCRSNPTASTLARLPVIFAPRASLPGRKLL
jgi:hypothetical protein